MASRYAPRRVSTPVRTWAGAVTQACGGRKGRELLVHGKAKTCSPTMSEYYFVNAEQLRLALCVQNQTWG